MRDLNYQLKRLAERNCDGSFATQSDRNRMLSLISNQLYALGFRHMTAMSLKPKHVAALVALWHSEKLSTGTIKNRMSALRWWAEKIGKPNVIDRGNGAYGIADRVFVTNESKAVTVGPDKLALIKDDFSAMSLAMQAAFGLRREESIKLIPEWADQGDFLRLKDSWTKGGALSGGTHHHANAAGDSERFQGAGWEGQPDPAAHELSRAAASFHLSMCTSGHPQGARAAAPVRATAIPCADWLARPCCWWPPFADADGRAQATRP